LILQKKHGLTTAETTRGKRVRVLTSLEIKLRKRGGINNQKVQRTPIGERGGGKST